MNPLDEGHERPGASEDEVFEAELLSEDENEWVDRRFPAARRPGAEAARGPAVEMAARSAVAVTKSVRSARTVSAVTVRVAHRAWCSERAGRARLVAGYRVRHAPADLLRLCWFVLRGWWRWIGKAWSFFTYGDLRADARTARVVGDAEARRKAQEMVRADSRARWARLGMALERLRALCVGLVMLGGALWLLDSVMTRAQMWPWLAGVYDVLAGTWTVTTIAAPLLAGAVALGLLVAAAFEGRDHVPGAGWLVRPDRDDADSWIDERMISQALLHLGISPLDKFFKDGGQLLYTVPARLDGNGTYAQVRLPMGVTADMVADRRDRLAANLGRAKLECWPTEAGEAGLLDLWVADKGVLARGAGRWPLAEDGEVDVFEGVPFGRSQRGDVVAAPILERNYVIGGQPGQGKSSAGRTICLGCVLDPSVELRVFVFASNPDFDPFAPRLARYVKGDDDEAIEAGLGELRRLRDEVTRRGKLLENYGAAKVTRTLASKANGLHPVVVVFDECHELFEHPGIGKEAGALAVRVIKKARKCGITCLFLTQSPTAASIPKDLTRNCSNGVAFAVADQVANDGLLGSGRYRAGIRATELRPGEDRGTAVTTGLTANRFELVNTFYVAFEDGDDQVSPVVARSMALLAGTGRALPGATEDDEPAPTDHLADIDGVLRGEAKVRTQVVLARLAEHNPGVYEGWSFGQLADALAAAGVSARKSRGLMVVHAADVALALADRDDDTADAGADADGDDDAG